MREGSLILPRRLAEGDLIGVAAPASPFDADEFASGAAVLEAMGLRVYIPGGIYRRRGYLAGSDSERAELLNGLFENRQVKAIICARGGFGSSRLLQYLDYEAIKKNPKIFVGFSDITAILSALYTRCGLVTYHGPLVTTFGDADRVTRESLRAVLMSDKKILVKPKNGVVIKKGVAAGPVSGGNLSILCHMLGTSVQPDYNGHILFVEERGEAPYRIDRMLTHLKQAGCFESLAGLIIGSFEGCGDNNEVLKIFSDITRSFDFPVISGFEAGHGKTNITIPMGLAARLDTYKKTLAFGRAATSFAE
ncbi:MAG: LD-carboxypeptidase [Deltaproteobacteria bacterium]|nr:LD-carboxypeptidase [Deltaproteobacteria bacterium]